MKQRLQKILSDQGVASRRKAEELIRSGRITVNGQSACLGQSADPGVDEILLDGKPLPEKAKPVYIMLHKPRGYVTTLSDEKGRRNVTELVKDCGVRVYPVGRLDMDSEGLLILTNDGEFANRLMHPSEEVDKTYLVWVAGFTEAGFRQLREPVTLDGYTIQPPDVALLDRSGDRARLRIIIHEGRNRQIRRMCQIASMRVIRLKRVGEGRLRLGTLPPGRWRYLSDEEVAGL